MNYTGGCQCGRVRYRAAGPRDRSSVCYCRMCQRASGGPFMAFVRFRAEQVEWSQPPDAFASSNIAERGFCRACGTPLFYRLLGGHFISLTLNSLDDPEQVRPEMQFSPEAEVSWLRGLGALPETRSDAVGAPGFVSYQQEIL